MSLMKLLLKTYCRSLVETDPKYIVSFLKRSSSFQKQLGTVVFKSNRSGLIHIWCTSEYLQQQEDECGIDLK